MKIAITGTTGRLGRALADAWQATHEIIELPRAVLDLAEPETLAAVLDPLEPEVLVNCAALTQVDECERPELAERVWTVNAAAPAALAAHLATRGARLVQLSTDYVFEGEGPGLRSESDPAVPCQHYGRSKLAGEQAVLAASAEHLVARVSWVFGPEKDSFLEGTIRRALTRAGAGAVADKWSLPLHTGEAAQALAALIDHPEARGVVHLAPSGPPCSWLEWAQCGIDALAARGVEFQTPQLVAQSLAEVPFFTAERPRHTALSTALLAQWLGQPLRDWREVVTEYVLSRNWD